jgi:hypothetical protein
MDAIRQIFDESGGTYGSPKVWITLVRQGWRVSVNTVARLMAELGLAGRKIRRCRGEYQSRRFMRACRRLGVTQSMGRVGSCFANAVSEAFNSVLKVEYVHRRTSTTRTEARLEIATWITGFYNTRRLHSMCGDPSPIDYERNHHADSTMELPLERPPRCEGIDSCARTRLGAVQSARTSRSPDGMIGGAGEPRTAHVEGECSSRPGSGCRHGVDVSISGAFPPSDCAVVLASARVGEEMARRRKGAEGRSSTHTTGLPGRMATKSIPALCLRVPMHRAPGIQTPRCGSPRKARHQAGSTVTRLTAVSGTRTLPRRAAAFSRHDKCTTKSSPSTNIRAIARGLLPILARESAECLVGVVFRNQQG